MVCNSTRMTNTSMNTDKPKHDCYVILKDSSGLNQFLYGFFLEEKTDGSGRTLRGMYIEKNLHYFPSDDVVNIATYLW